MRKLMLDTLHDRGLVTDEDFSLVIRIHIYGFTYRELAEEYNVPIGTLLSRVSRIMMTLRKAVEQLDQEVCS